MSIDSDMEAAVRGLGARLSSMCMCLLVRHGHAIMSTQRPFRMGEDRRCGDGGQHECTGKIASTR